MGFNTAVMLCNDELHTVAESKTFGKDLIEAVSEAYCYNKSVRVRCSNAIVLPSEHADVKRIIVVGGNDIQKSSLFLHMARSSEDALEMQILKAAADKMGYYLRKK